MLILGLLWLKGLVQLTLTRHCILKVETDVVEAIIKDIKISRPGWDLITYHIVLVLNLSVAKKVFSR